MDSVLSTRIKTMLPHLDEKQKRLFLALEANALGHGGVKLVHEITGVSQTTIIRGKKEIASGEIIAGDRTHASGGGRKKLTKKYENIKDEIEKIVADDTYGNPENPLTWTTKSLRNLQECLEEMGYEIKHDTVGKILKELGYSLQRNRKMLQLGESHPDRDEQFRFINQKSCEFIQQNQPVISVDAKKKEAIGNFINGGAEYSKKKNPTKVLDHDFPIKELGKVTPYGIFDMSKNEGFVNLGISGDTSEFAVVSILRWWQTLGINTYPSAKKLYINCDGGGSNDSRRRLWKKQLQDFANITSLEVHISHFPPGTSKWNKIEHRMFCFISKNWRGKPLISVETVIHLISSTTTSKGLKIICIEDKNYYKLGTKVTDAEFASINIVREDFHGNWNYAILPNKKVCITLLQLDNYCRHSICRCRDFHGITFDCYEVT
jgi:transposase